MPHGRILLDRAAAFSACVAVKMVAFGILGGFGFRVHTAPPGVLSCAVSMTLASLVCNELASCQQHGKQTWGESGARQIHAVKCILVVYRDFANG